MSICLILLNRRLDRLHKRIIDADMNVLRLSKRIAALEAQKEGDAKPQ